MNPQGWIVDPENVDKVCQTLQYPNFQTGQPTNDDAMLHLTYRDLTGKWQNSGVQQIGDCVSFGFARMVDYTQVMDRAFDTSPGIQLDYEETATEVIYAGSRVEIGGRQIRGDGSIGAWAAKYIQEYGTISRLHLERLGLPSKYSGLRAKDWGHRGSPDSIKSTIKLHPMQEITQVLDFRQAMWHIQSGRTIAVCSNVGFENGGNGRTVRDADGFARRAGNWAHCMTFVSGRMGRRPGLLCVNQWPPELVSGPTGPTDLPPNCWWVDQPTADLMLGQRDSWTCSSYKGYPVRSLTWSH